MFLIVLFRNVLMILPLVFLMAVGYLLRYFGFWDEKDVKLLIKTLFWIITPVMLFRSVYNSADVSHLKIIYVVGLYMSALAAAIISYAMERYVFHRSRQRLAFSVASAMRPNTVYVGLPTVQLVMGEKALGAAALYVAVAIPFYNCVTPMASEIVLASGKNLKAVFKATFIKIIRNPLVIAPILGICLLCCGVHSLPQIIDNPLRMIGVCATGLSLLALGASLSVKGFLPAMAASWTDVTMRLAIHPLLVWLFFMFFPVDPTMARAAVLETATPSAVTLFILAGGLGLDVNYAGQVVLISTLLSSLSIPIWATIMGI